MELGMLVSWFDTEPLSFTNWQSVNFRHDPHYQYDLA